MKAKIVRIGNSQGIRIPKLLLEETGLEGDVEIRVEDQTLVISSVDHPRANWNAAFESMARRGDDELLDSHPIAADWDEEEWEWE